MRRHQTIRLRRKRRLEEQFGAAAEKKRPSPTAHPEQLGPHYKAGPVYGLSASSPEHIAQEKPVVSASEDREKQAFSQALEAEQEQDGGAQSETRPAQEAVPALEGQGEPDHAIAFNQRGPLRLQGRTDADFDGGSFRTENTRIEAAHGCPGCSRTQCVRCTGTLVATYRVQTRVTLPQASDFPGLTPCQQRRVQNAINDILVPHEQEHVAAFEAYNGTTRRSFDLKICRSRFHSTIRRMFLDEERDRRSAAQAASDALDPFHFDLELDCEEPQTVREEEVETAAAANTSLTETIQEETRE